MLVCEEAGGVGRCLVEVDGWKLDVTREEQVKGRTRGRAREGHPGPDGTVVMAYGWMCCAFW